MTSRQKYIVAALVVVNSLVILTLVALVTRSCTASPSSPALTPVTSDECQQLATQLLAQAGLGGVVSLTSDELRFDITYPLAHKETPDEAAQQVWIAFDISMALMENQCAVFSQIEVVILALSSEGETRITAQVSAADLKAFYAGELDEEAFIERVLYDTS